MASRELSRTRSAATPKSAAPNAFERVARAITAKRYALAAKAMAGGSVGLGMDGDIGRQLARAALEAVREPTPEMLAATVLSGMETPLAAADFALADAALKLLPPTSHPERRVVLAEIARDHRAQIAAALRGSGSTSVAAQVSQPIREANNPPPVEGE